MNREYHNGFSHSLGREMELLVFGHAGLPVLVFPTSGGRFYDFEDRGMIAALDGKISAGQLQLFCVDSIDRESWYNRRLPPHLRIARHKEYEHYLLDEVLPLVRRKNSDPRLLTMGCSLGGYHAVNIALRHPGRFSGFLSLSGIFDLSSFLDGYYDRDCYFQFPAHYLPNLTDPRYIDPIRNASCTLVTGWDDQCLAENQNLDRILTDKQIPHRFFIWQAENTHDWPTWQRMAQQYL
jgi:esterase/lipase superfamily enzyme